jgi:hypothetical protein
VRRPPHPRLHCASSARSQMGHGYLSGDIALHVIPSPTQTTSHPRSPPRSENLSYRRAHNNNTFTWSSPRGRLATPKRTLDAWQSCQPGPRVLNSVQARHNVPKYSDHVDSVGGSFATMPAGPVRTPCYRRTGDSDQRSPGVVQHSSDALRPIRAGNVRPLVRPFT